jgi:DNA-binding ferritin-like protein
MSEYATPRGRFGRRALTGVAVLSIAAFGAAWSGCGDDNEDEVNDAIENANDQIESISEEAQQQADEAQEQADEATDEALEQAQEAQDQAEQEIEEGGGTTTTP